MEQHRARTCVRNGSQRFGQCWLALRQYLAIKAKQHIVGAGCTVYEQRPEQCRTFPFWPEIVERKATWNRTARYCPGIGKGPLIQIGTAMETAEEQRRAYPEMYK